MTQWVPLSTTNLMMTMRIKVWVFPITGHKRILLSNINKKNGLIETFRITTSNYRVGNQWRKENQGHILGRAMFHRVPNLLLITPKTSSIVSTVSAVNSRQILIKPTKSSRMSIRIISLRYLNKVQISKLWREMLTMSLNKGSLLLLLRHHLKIRLTTCPNHINTA